MRDQHVDGVQKRLRIAVRRYVEKQRERGKANDVAALRERAADALSGWTETAVRTWGEWKSKARDDQLPRLSVLMEFCAVTGDSADYILFGDGAERRGTRKRGAKLTRDELASELAAHLAEVVRDGQTVTIHAIDGREALRAVERAAIEDRDFVQAGDGGWIDSEAAGLLRAAIPRLPVAQRAEYEALARFLRTSATNRRKARERRIRSRDVRIVVDLDTITDPDRPVYRKADRTANGPPQWIVKVGNPPDA